MAITRYIKIMYKYVSCQRTPQPVSALHLLHQASHLAAGDHLHHLAGLLELLQQAVHLLDVRAAALCDAVAAAAVQDFRMLAFLRGHGVDDGLDALEGVVVNVDVLDGFAYTGNHAGQLLEVTHLLDLLNLTHEVVEVKLVLLNLLLQALSFLFVVLLLSTFYERDDITHAEDTVGHT